MTVQRWIVENLEGQSTPARVGAFAAKATIEGGMFAVLGALFALAVTGVLDIAGITVPTLPATRVGLAVMLAGAIGAKGWCFLTD